MRFEELKATFLIRPSNIFKAFQNNSPLYHAGGHAGACPFSRWAHLREACNWGLASNAWHFSSDQWSSQHQRAPAKLDSEADDSISWCSLDMIWFRSLLTTFCLSELILWMKCYCLRMVASYGCLLVLRESTGAPIDRNDLNMEAQTTRVYLYWTINFNKCAHCGIANAILISLAVDYVRQAASHISEWNYKLQLQKSVLTGEQDSFFPLFIKAVSVAFTSHSQSLVSPPASCLPLIRCVKALQIRTLQLNCKTAK